MKSLRYPVMEPDKLASDLLGLSQRLARALRTTDRGGRLTIEHLNVLLILLINRRITIKELAALERVAHSTMSRRIASMSAASLIRARVSNDDRRESKISLTPKGRRAAETELKHITAYFADAIEALPSRKKTDLAKGAVVLDALLERVAENSHESA